VNAATPAPANPAKVIILSAGQGRRLLPVTESLPKCLVRLSGRTLLEWQLRRLDEIGVAEAVVVVGFSPETVEAELQRLSFNRLRARTLYNPFFAVADNLASCWVARDEFDQDVLLLNGDTLFERAVAERLAAAPPAPITVAVDRKATYDDDDMKVATEGSRLLAIGKTIETYNAESIGFLRFSREGARLFIDAVEAALRRPEGLKRWYLSVIDQLARTAGGVQVQSIEGLDWGEMDFPEDIARNSAITARWLEREAAEAAA
jgi:choline kinase